MARLRCQKPPLTGFSILRMGFECSADYFTSHNKKYVQCRNCTYWVVMILRIGSSAGTAVPEVLVEPGGSLGAGEGVGSFWVDAPV